jgi:hypothetical protein
VEDIDPPVLPRPLVETRTGEVKIRIGARRLSFF